MKIEIETSSLTQHIEALMFRARMTYRQLADAIASNHTTVWRAVQNPSAARAALLFKIIRYLQIDWLDFAYLFAKEIDGRKIKQ